MKLRERDVTAQVKGWLEVNGWTGYRMQSGTVRGVTQGTFMRLNKPGTPDWIFCKGKSYCFVEMKATEGRLREVQVQWLMEANRKGVPALVASDLKTFQLDFVRLMMEAK